jgi:hypothetical protein
MKISDVIQRLQTIHGEHGDLEVSTFDREQRSYDPVDEVYVSSDEEYTLFAGEEVVVIG